MREVDSRFIAMSVEITNLQRELARQRVMTDLDHEEVHRVCDELKAFFPTS